MHNLKLSCQQFFKSPEKAFVSIGLFFGILFLLVIPPFQVPDEPNHFFRAYQISEGKFVAEKRDNIVGGLIPQSLIDSLGIWDGIKFHPQSKTTTKQVLETFKISLQKDEKLFVGFPNTALYSPIPYLPQAIGIALGKAFYLSPIILMYLGRLTNLLISVYITFIGIKILPAFKWVFFLLALTPMATFQRSSLSADSFINGVAILLIAIITKYAFDRSKEKIVRNDIFILCLLSILLSLSKQVYFLIPFLCFLIPKYKFATQKKYWVTCLFLSLTSAIAWIFWSFVIKEIYVPLRPDAVVSTSEQARFVLSHPGKFAVIALNDFSLNLDRHLKQFIGVLGWLDTDLPSSLLISYSHLLVAIALIDSRPNVIIRFKDKSKIIAVLFASIFLIYFLTYLAWTPVGKEAVEGIQGRYFIPIAPLLFLLFYNTKLTLNIQNNKLGLVIVLYSLFVLTISLSVLISRYYNL